MPAAQSFSPVIIAGLKRILTRLSGRQEAWPINTSAQGWHPHPLIGLSALPLEEESLKKLVPYEKLVQNNIQRHYNGLVIGATTKELFPLK